MAATYKTFLNNDITSTRTMLHEAIPITGSIVSGTYSEGSTATSNIKTYSHGMFESVYDYPYLSSSANHIFDIVATYSSDSDLSASSGRTQQDKKINLYNQMALMLVPTDITGNIQQFDADGNLVAGGTKMEEAWMLNFSRLLVKDEIKKGSFELELGVAEAYNQAGATFAKRIKLTDTSGSTGFKTNSPAGEYGILYASTSAGTSALQGETLGNAETNPAAGLIYYQAGVAVISGSIFNASDDAAVPKGLLISTLNSSKFGSTAGTTGYKFVTGSSIETTTAAIRNRIYNIKFNNTTELNSTIYFCRANHNEFNYSSNPTYLTGSKIRVKETSFDQPVAYITTIGLYSADNELLAIAKLSEPIKKTPETELTFRVRLDY
mgnify:CR=1 FL=1